VCVERWIGVVSPPTLNLRLCVSLSASSRPVLSHLCYSRSVKLLGPVVERLGGRVRCVVGSPSRRSTGAVRAHE